MSDTPKRHMKDVIYDAYLGRIQRGELTPDDRLVDTAIAAEFDVSRMPVRDALMQELDATHPGYGLGQHKGYGTAQHAEALTRLGPAPCHRMSFAPVQAAAATSG